MNLVTDQFARLGNRIRSHSGPLTEQLVRRPGDFGLGQVPDRLAPDSTTSMTCGFCSTGCSLKIHMKDGQAVNLTPESNYPVNNGMACPKGWEALAPLAAPDRAVMPLLRNTRGSLPTEIDWPTASAHFCGRMKTIIEEHGPESVAFLSTGQICTEEMAFLGAFAKFGMGMIHGDGNTRQCMATAVRAYKESFGFDAPPYTYADFEESDVIVLVGSNLCIAHPIMWQRVLRNKRNPDIVVIDPRKTETAMQATQHLAIAPKSDLVFFYGLARLLIEKDLIHREFLDKSTSGFDEFAEHVEQFTTEFVAAETGISPDELESLAELIGSGKRVSFWWTMGVNQGHEATRTAQAIINLALMTGNIGKPGTGANSITGQCNAMGSRLFSNTTNLLGGHDFTSRKDREKVAGILGIDPGVIPDQNILAYDQIIEGIRDGKIKALWVVCTNPAHSWIGRKGFKDILGKLDFLVVQDMYHNTETAQLADLVLPAAGWGEKDGTLINSERRIGLVKKISRAPGEALSDFSIFKLLANAWGCGEMFADWQTPEDVFRIMKKLSAGQPCDITGIDGYDQLEKDRGIQWPYPKSAEPPFLPERRLFKDGEFFTDDGKAKFIFADRQPDPEPPDDEFPLRLLTGRGSSAQWHTQTRTRKSEVLQKLGPKSNFMEIHPRDAEEIGIAGGDSVRVTSRRGTILVKAFLTSAVPRGCIFIPMHEAETNRITLAVFDPHSRQPSYKSCAVRVSKG